MSRPISTRQPEKRRSTGEVLLELHADVEAHHAGVRRAVLVDAAVVADHVDELQVMAVSALEIVGIVRRRDLHRSRSEVHVHQNGVRDDRDASPIDRVDHVLSVQVLVARIVGVHRHGRIAQHRLQTRRRHHDLLVRVLHGVRELRDAAELIELVAMAGHFAQSPSLQIDVLHLCASRPSSTVLPISDSAVRSWQHQFTRRRLR